ncbi:MAG: metallophosphoesterase N-terminal domain-containing protein, partial [Phycisphaerae bacterium]
MNRHWTAVVCLCSMTTLVVFAQPQTAARGVVYHDQNGNAARDADERGIPGVCVSNGEIVVQTDHKGEYELPVSDDTMIFVIKPRDWMTRIDEDRLPRYYYDHKPVGSAPHLQYPGVSATGPLPGTIDFPLVSHEEPDEFQVLVFGDTQPRDDKEIHYIAHDVVDGLVGNNDAAFGVTLGDVVFDDLSIYGHLNSVIGKIGVPWYNIHGNHDMNYDVAEDIHADETWERIYGPNYYSFNWGPVHFVALDNIAYEGLLTNRNYHGELGEKQLRWL